MRLAVIFPLLLTVVAGCATRTQARLARTHPAPLTLEVTGPLHWSDRIAGKLEATIACRRTTVEVWCRELGRAVCDAKRMLAETVACPAVEVTLTTGAGAVTEATVEPDGRATFAVGTATAVGSVGASARIARDGLTLGWRDGETLLIEAERPVPPAPRPQRRYAATMVATDLAIVLTAPMVIAATKSPAAAVAYLGLYLASGPVIHGIHGNRGAIGWSAARRVLYPSLAAGAALLAVSSGRQDCDGHACWISEGGAIGLVVGSAVLGMLGAMVHDYTDAHVDVGPARITPVVSSDGEHTSIGVSGRF